MTKALLRRLPLIILALGLNGCFHHQVKTELIQVEEQSLPKLNTKHSVQVVAIQNSRDQQITVCGGFPASHTYYAQLNDLTDAAKVSLEQILKQKNVTVNDQGNKTLKLAVTQAYCTNEGMFTLTYKVKLQINAGDAIAQEITGSQTIGPSMRGTNLAVSLAINNALLNMLNIDRIVTYLEN